MAIFRSLLVISLLLLCPLHLSAQEGEETGTNPEEEVGDSLTIPCPRIIASVSDNIFDRSKKAYRCFRTKRDARKSGYLNSRRIGALDFTGTWKLTVRLNMDTCGDIDPNTPEAIPNFLNVVQSESRIVGVPVPEPDPMGTTYIGTVIDDGFIASSEDTMQNCDGRNGKFTTTYRLEQIRGSESMKATYSIDKQCDSLNTDQAISCRTTFTGTAELFEEK